MSQAIQEATSSPTVMHPRMLWTAEEVADALAVSETLVPADLGGHVAVPAYRPARALRHCGHRAVHRGPREPPPPLVVHSLQSPVHRTSPYRAARGVVRME